MFETDATSILWGISPILLIVGALYHVTSVAAPHWLANSTAHWGLWKYCPRAGDCISVSEQLDAIEHSWYRTVQGVEVCATVFVLAAVVTGLMRINLGHRIWQTASGICAIIAGIFGLSGVIVYARNFDTLEGQCLSWAYIFNVASSAMCILCGPILIVDSLRHTS